MELCRPCGCTAARADAARTTYRLRQRFPEAGKAPPTDFVAEAIRGIRALLDGEKPFLSTLPLDLAGVPTFDRRVYAQTAAIPPGRVRTYGEIAADLGEPGAAREIGAALARNPFPLIVPCHRVVAAGGRLGGFSAAGGTITKRRLLEIERARTGSGPDLFDFVGHENSHPANPAGPAAGRSKR